MARCQKPIFECDNNLFWGSLGKHQNGPGDPVIASQIQSNILPFNLPRKTTSLAVNVLPMTLSKNSKAKRCCSSGFTTSALSTCPAIASYIYTYIYIGKQRHQISLGHPSIHMYIYSLYIYSLYIYIQFIYIVYIYIVYIYIQFMIYIVYIYI